MTTCWLSAVQTASMGGEQIRRCLRVWSEGLRGLSMLWRACAAVDATRAEPSGMPSVSLWTAQGAIGTSQCMPGVIVIGSPTTRRSQAETRSLLAFDLRPRFVRARLGGLQTEATLGKIMATKLHVAA